MTQNLKQIMQEIHLWHNDCCGETCEIKKALEDNVSTERLIEIVLDVDPELIERLEAKKVKKMTKDIKLETLHNHLMEWNGWGEYQFKLDNLDIDIITVGYNPDTNDDLDVIKIFDGIGNLIAKYQTRKCSFDKTLILQARNERIIDEIIHFLNNKIKII